MDDEGNCLAANKPSAKRRAMAATSPEGSLHQQGHSTPKKRVVLGELTNIVDAAAIPSATKILNPKPKSQSSTKVIDQKEPVKSEVDLHGGSPSPSDDSQKFAHAPLLYHHLRLLEVEEERRPLPDYMKNVQKEITPAMREVLVDWLVEVADEFRLVSDTLYLTVNYIDRYLSSNVINKSKLQLLGVSSMLVASKVEEIMPPRVEDCCYITDNTYNKEEVTAMESNVLKFLNNNTYNPTPKSFLRIFAKAAEVNSKMPHMVFEFLASYIAELSLTDYVCVKFLPSMIAASAIFLANFTVLPTIHPWNLELQQYTGYKVSDLKECILAIHHILLNKRRSSSRAVREKYMEHKYKRVAAMCPQSEIPRHYFEVMTRKTCV